MSSTSASGDSASQKRSRVNVDVTMSSGNIFADIGLPNAEELLFKADLVTAISAVIQRRRLSQSSVAKIVRIDQPKVIALLSGDTRGFSASRLIRILSRLGQNIEIRVRDSKKAKGRIRVDV
jgi:predicted XRE-type DNA-binding protein